MNLTAVKEKMVELDEPERPMAELHRWMQLGKILVAEEVRNHPRLGTVVARTGGEAITTSTVTYLNRKLHMAITRNTVYLLFDEVTG